LTPSADLAIRGGRVVLGSRVVERDVLVVEGRVDRIAEPGTGRAAEEVDARGLVVIPGAVDAHAHFNEPGRGDWEGWLAGTRGAALGGITTVCDMPLNSIPPTLDAAAFDAKRELAASCAVVDHALWGGLVGTPWEGEGPDAGRDAGPAPDTVEAMLRDLRRRGAVGVKAFLSESGVPEFPRVPEERLIDALVAAARAGVLVAVHCEDEAITRSGAERCRAEGRRDADAWVASRPAEAEVRAIERLADAALAAGARVHVVHVSSAAAVRAIRAARQRGVAMTGETCPHYLTFTDADVRRSGTALKCAPPIRGEAERDALWRAVASGGLDLVASDHSPCPAEMKRSDDVFAAWGGIAGVQSFLPALLTEGLQKRRVDLVRLVRLVAEAPARLLGIFPRKGAIREGSDADLALLDLEREWTLDAADVAARSAVSPYVGRRFTGAVARTIVRGVTVQRDGAVVVGPGHGRLVTP
jgi:allantoinase